MHCLYPPWNDRGKRLKVKLDRFIECFYWPVRNHSGLIEADNEGKYKTGRHVLLAPFLAFLITKTLWWHFEISQTHLHTPMFHSKTCRNKGMKIQKTRRNRCKPTVETKQIVHKYMCLHAEQWRRVLLLLATLQYTILPIRYTLFSLTLLERNFNRCQ